MEFCVDCGFPINLREIKLVRSLFRRNKVRVHDEEDEIISVHLTKKLMILKFCKIIGVESNDY